MDSVRSLGYNKTPKIIEKETGRKFTDICSEMLQQGLSPTEIARELRLKSSQFIKSTIYVENTKGSLETSLFPTLFEAVKNGARIQEEFYKHTGIQYKDFLYQKYIQEGLSYYEIAELLGCITYKSVCNHVRKYGFAKNKSQARQDAIKKGKIDYRNIIASTKKTARKSNTYSNVQEMVRDIFKEEFLDALLIKGLDNVEVIIGFNDWGILKSKEVDIPIIVIEGNVFKKYSVELNSDWHEERVDSDNKKALDLEKKGWNHFELFYNSSNFGELSNDVKNIVDKIIKEKTYRE